MDNKNFKMVDLSDLVAIPVPRGLTPEDEAEYIAQYKAKYLANFEEEYEELKNIVEGKVPMVSFTELLRDLDEEDKARKKESA